MTRRAIKHIASNSLCGGDFAFFKTRDCGLQHLRKILRLGLQLGLALQIH
jgi:hypothetical protein